MKSLFSNFTKVVQGSVLFFIFCFYNFSLAKVIWSLENELGLYNTSNSETLEGNFKLNGEIKIKEKLGKNNFSLQTNFRPEFYNSFKILKFNSKGTYSQRFKNSNLISSINYKKNFYFLQNSEFHYDIFKISLEGSHLLKPKTLLVSNLNLYYRDFENGIRNNLDVVSSEINILKPISKKQNYKIGFYTERFSIKIRESFQSSSNKGYRLGTQVGFDFKKRFVFNLNYRFLWHLDDLNGVKSFENWIRVFFAKVIFKKVTLLVLADFYLRDFETQEGANLNLLYTSINTENRIHLKLERKISKRLDLYLKTGYQKEELVYNNSSLSGWNASFGVEFKGKK